jgi:hypothetical protein
VTDGKKVATLTVTGSSAKGSGDQPYRDDLTTSYGYSIASSGQSVSLYFNTDHGGVSGSWVVSISS